MSSAEINNAVEIDCIVANNIVVSNCKVEEASCAKVSNCKSLIIRPTILAKSSLKTHPTGRNKTCQQSLKNT